jgi:hypothetical protein
LVRVNAGKAPRIGLGAGRVARHHFAEKNLVLRLKTVWRAGAGQALRSDLWRQIKPNRQIRLQDGLKSPFFR